MNEQETIQSYPLQWPAGWRRTKDHVTARFYTPKHRLVNQQYYQSTKRLTVAEGANRVMEQLRLMGLGDWQIVVSTNVRPRLDGMPRSGESEPKDPGAAVYWQHDKSGHRCMAVDRYDRVADNLAAIAATLEAMRAIERHGGAAILDRAFTGFKALPEPEQWFQVLGLDSPDVTEEEIKAAYHQKARESHPDIPGGDTTAMARINAARDRGLEEISLGVGR